MGTSACPGCSAVFEEHEGPVHRYMDSSAACWAAFGEILTREYQDPAYFAVHKYTVDAYAVQHPGRPSPQTIQSVAVHLIRLCLMLECGADNQRASAAIQAATEGNYFWLTPPASMGPVTVKEVFQAAELAVHKRLVRAWAESTWQAWSAHHDQIRSWIPKGY